MKYRPEIDGLRAIAVLPVILFHAGFEVFSGGFVGVDVFFVISGYLITRILIDEIDAKRFRIVHFYERRARRILPALFFVMAACLPCAWVWMMPSQMEDFSQSLVAVSLFASNILFWRKSGYFDPAAEERPMLHTWSLAVEEQYYLLFPLFLLVVWRFGRGAVFWMIVLCAGLSLMLSEWGWRHMPTANFYLAPSRVWELFAGSITACLVNRHGLRPHKLGAALGLAAILGAIFLFDRTTPFPSLLTLVPVGGAVLVILYAGPDYLGQDGPAARLLRSRILVGIGLISYSAYLWHQPLFAFARLRMGAEPGLGIMAGLCGVTLLLAAATWAWIEHPFRDPARISRRTIFSGALTGMVAFAAFGLIGHSNGGYIFRLKDDFKTRYAYVAALQEDRQALIKGGQCQFNQLGAFRQIDDFLAHWSCHEGRDAVLRIAVFGDSHAADKAAALVANDVPVTRLTGAGCGLLREGQKFPYCTALFDRIDQELRAHPYDVLILANRFHPDELSPDYLQALVQYWSPLAKHIVLFSPMIEFPDFQERYTLDPTQDFTARMDLQDADRFAQALAGIDLPSNVQIIETKDIFCRMTSMTCAPIIGSDLMLVDAAHLSPSGALAFGRQFLEDWPCPAALDEHCAQLRPLAPVAEVQLCALPADPNALASCPQP